MAKIWHRIISYLSYRLKARDEHSFHSPFVFDFATRIAFADKNYYAFQAIEKERLRLEIDNSLVSIEELGALQKGNYKKKISDIANTSVMKPKYAQLLFKCIDFYQCQSVLELGTNLGITTAYLTSANKKAKITSIEGNQNLITIAQRLHHKLGLNNIDIKSGLFDDILPKLLAEHSFDFVLIDGNHTKQATLQYFDWLKAVSNPNMILVFDDIYWSKGMTEAWQIIKADKTVSLTLDLYQLGFVFFKQGMEKQDFILKF
jgi:predicted O-methyltransferase YrrM